jgi:hypothetical protein
VHSMTQSVFSGSCLAGLCASWRRCVLCVRCRQPLLSSLCSPAHPSRCRIAFLLFSELICPMCHRVCR